MTAKVTAQFNSLFFARNRGGDGSSSYMITLVKLITFTILPPVRIRTVLTSIIHNKKGGDFKSLEFPVFKCSCNSHNRDERS